MITFGTTIATKQLNVRTADSVLGASSTPCAGIAKHPAERKDAAAERMDAATVQGNVNLKG